MLHAQMIISANCRYQKTRWFQSTGFKPTP
jgi:hypothetical protein